MHYLSQDNPVTIDQLQSFAVLISVFRENHLNDANDTLEFLMPVVKMLLSELIKLPIDKLQLIFKVPPFYLLEVVTV